MSPTSDAANEALNKVLEDVRRAEPLVLAEADRSRDSAAALIQSLIQAHTDITASAVREAIWRLLDSDQLELTDDRRLVPRERQVA